MSTTYMNNLDDPPFLFVCDLNRSCSTRCLDFSYERHVIYFNLFQKVISVLKIPFLRLDLMNNYKNEQVRRSIG